MEELSCAKCSGTLEEVRLGDIAIDRCMQCRGLFFGNGELSRVLTDGSIEDLPQGHAQAPSHMDVLVANCPRCRIQMQRLQAGAAGQFAYDVCPACHGLWLDAGELAHLEHATASQLLEGRDADTRRRRAAAVVEQLEALIGQVERQRDDRLSRLDKLIMYGLSDSGEIRSIRSAIDAEATLARESLGQSRLFEEARRLCIEGIIGGAIFESIRQRVAAR